MSCFRLVEEITGFLGKESVGLTKKRIVAREDEEGRGGGGAEGGGRC